MSGFRRAVHQRWWQRGRHLDQHELQTGCGQYRCELMFESAEGREPHAPPVHPVTPGVAGPFWDCEIPKPSDCGKAGSADSGPVASRTWSGLFGWDFGKLLAVECP